MRQLRPIQLSPADEFLDLDFPNEYANSLEIAAQVPANAAAFLTQCLQRIESNRSLGKSRVDELSLEHTCSLLMLRRMIEIADAIGVQTREGCCGALHQQVRSLFELALGLVHLLAADQRRRAAAYRVVGLTHDLELLNRVDPDSPGHADYIKIATREGFTPFIFSAEQAAAHRSFITRQLSRPVFADAFKQWEQLRNERKPAHWYTLYGGPHNLRGLARRYDNEGIYLDLYKYWSRYTHGTETRSDHALHGGTIYLRPVRWISGLKSNALITHTLCVESAKRVLAFFESNSGLSWWRYRFHAHLRPTVEQLRKHTLNGEDSWHPPLSDPNTNDEPD